VLEVLEKAPGVTIDHQNDQLKLRNKTGVLVMVDGKRSYLSDADLNNYLRSIRSEQVSTIEIITNPSSKYDAAGNSGIINIILKKNTALGTNGLVSLSGGNAYGKGEEGDLFNGSVNLNLNHKLEKWNIYGNANTARESDYNKIVLFRLVDYEGIKSTFDQYFYKPRKTASFSGKFGIDYEATKKTTIGIMLDANSGSGKLKNDSRTSITESNNGVSSSSSLIQNSDANAPRTNMTTNFNLKHAFDKKGMELVFDADYSGFRNERNQTFNTDFLNQQGNIYNNIQQQNNTLAKINIYAAKIDFTLPLNNMLKLEAGLKTGKVSTDNDFVYEILTNGSWLNDPSKSNRFIYKENINAAYVNMGKEWSKWSIQAGLRAEYTQSDGNSVTDSQIFSNNYLSLFPTFFLNHSINKNNKLRYSYSRRLDRPNYQQLNPFVFFLDPYTLEQGNPYLKPQFTDNFELSYTYKNEVSVSVSYSNTNNYILNLTEQDDSTRIVKTYQGNIGNFKNYAANLSFPLAFTSWWNMQNQFSLYYNHFSDSNLFNGALAVGKVAYNFNTSNVFALTKSWTAELSMWYNSPGVNGIERSNRAQYSVNAGIQKSLLNNQAHLKFNVNDLFYSSYFSGNLDYQNLDFSVSNKWASRRATISFSYKFGNQGIKDNGNRRTATEDLKNRVR
ncbi:MAG: TonB-dependent receptor, partial [Pedobacter sp.]|nr:TonB-dependent receptor [Pedobacter sp.]